MDTDKLLMLLEKDGKLTCTQLAAMLNSTEGEVAAVISELEKNKVILGYGAVIDWEKTGRELVTAMIEVKVVPQRGEGFDRVASRIYQYHEVDSVYLMSGGFDLLVMLAGKTLKEVALFVAQKLAVMESVSSTATHFVLKKYKDRGVIFTAEPDVDMRTPLG
jgi:DNA-binding Lrp family transcriptional regulator